MSKRSGKTLWWWIGLMGLAAVARGANPPAAPTPDTVVELPKFEVTDSRVLPPPEKWHYAAVPGFEILSNVSERETKRFVRDFLLLQDALTVLMPTLGRGEVAVPALLLLCGGRTGFDRFVPADRSEDVYRANSLFFDHPERAAIVVDFAQSELQLDATTTVGADPYHGFYKEYFRHLIRHQGARPPAWFEEGLVRILSAIDFNKQSITFAQINDNLPAADDTMPPDAADRDFTQLLAHRALMPLSEFFAQTAGSGDAFWSAQCYAFVHMCLYGRGKKYQPAFAKFVGRLGTQEPSEALFKECFKMSYKDMESEIRGYVNFTDHKWIQFIMNKGQALAEPPPVALRAATDAEAGRMTGEVLRLGGHGDEAHLALIAPYVRGERDPQLLAALGLDERAAGHDDRARKFLEAAAQAGAVRPRAYLELARLRYEAVKPTADAGEKPSLTPAQVSAILAPLATARSQPPPMAEVFELTAEVWAHSAQPPSRADLKVINQGVMLFPRRPRLLARAADLNLRHGDPEDARRIITYALGILPDSPARVAMEQLREALPPPPATPRPAPAGAKASGAPVAAPVKR